MAAAFNFVEGYAVLWLRRLNAFGVSMATPFLWLRRFSLRVSMASLFLGLGLFADNKKGAEK